MLPYCTLRTLLTLLLALTLRLATAQTGWQQLYTASHPQWNTKALRQSDGGVLLIGTEELKPFSSKQTAPRRLVLLRTDDHGRQLWEQRLTLPGLPGFFLDDATQNARGELLISLLAELPLQGGLYPNYLVQLTPNGPIHWTRDFRGTKRTVTALAPDDANQGFVVGLDYYNGYNAALLYLLADGSQRQVVPLTGGLGTLLAQPGGTLVGAGAKVFFLSYDGVRGLETTLPSGSNASLLLELGGNDFLVHSGQIHRFTLGSSTMQWTQNIYTGEGTLVPQTWATSPTGEVLIKGFAMRNSHFASDFLVLLRAADGTIQRREDNNTLAVTKLPDSPAGSVVSVLPGAEPGTFIIAGFVPEGMFLQLGRFPELTLGAPTTLAAWPNPVSDDALLQVNSSFAAAHPLYLYDLSGHQVASWPAVAGGTAQLSVRGLHPGIYLLVGTNGQGKTSHMRIYKQ